MEIESFREGLSPGRFFKRFMILEDNFQVCALQARHISAAAAILDLTALIPAPRGAQAMRASASLSKGGEHSKWHKLSALNAQ